MVYISMHGSHIQGATVTQFFQVPSAAQHGMHRGCARAAPGGPQPPPRHRERWARPGRAPGRCCARWRLLWGHLGALSPQPAPCSPGGAPNRRRAAARESALRARARGARGRHREPHPSTQLGSGRRAAAPPARPFLTRCYRSLEGAVERQPSTRSIDRRLAGRRDQPQMCGAKSETETWRRPLYLRGGTAA